MAALAHGDDDCTGETPGVPAADVTLSPGALVCENVTIQGSVTFGPGTVVQPRCRFLATGGGRIVVGADNIFEEQCTVVNDSPGELRIGALNLFEVGAIVRNAQCVGDGNKIGARSEIGRGARVGDHTLIAPLTRVQPDYKLPANTVLAPNLRQICDGAALHRAHMADYLGVLRDPASRTCLLNFHSVR